MPELINAEKLLRCEALDCRPAAEGAPDPVIPKQAQSIDYQAKDYDSFVRALLDLIPSRIPGWKDRSEADLGMALIELFAFTGDQLSYYQDRVANEAYLRTAVQYESVRRLLSLIDYQMDPGVSPLCILALTTSRTKFLPAGFEVSTAPSDAREPVVFETEGPRVLYAELNSIALHSNAPADAARKQAVLAGELDTVISPGTWVLLTSAEASEWAQTSGPVAVNHVLHTSTVTFTRPLTGTFSLATTIVNANGVVATHGRTRTQRAVGSGLPNQVVQLLFAPVTYTRMPDDTSRISLKVLVDGETWTEVDDFIDSGPAGKQFRLTQDNEGVITVRFGDERQGRAPAASATIELRYREGNGEAGLVAANTLVRYLDPDGFITAVTNPLPSTGARNPQSLGEAKLLGPRAMRQQNRAVTPDDYETLLLRGVRLGGDVISPLHAKARLVWSGSWYTVFVSVDFEDRLPLKSVPGRREALENVLNQRKLAGFDVQLEDARYAPLHLGLVVHVRSGYFARTVREQVQAALSDRGFFEPRRFSFGQAVYLSDLYAAALAVEGIEYLSVSRFKRLGDRYPDRAGDGMIEIGPLEIARLDNDSANPQFGVLYVRTCGGKEG